MMVTILQPAVFPVEPGSESPQLSTIQYKHDIDISSISQVTDIPDKNHGDIYLFLHRNTSESSPNSDTVSTSMSEASPTPSTSLVETDIGSIDQPDTTNDNISSDRMVEQLTSFKKTVSVEGKVADFSDKTGYEMLDDANRCTENVNGMLEVTQTSSTTVNETLNDDENVSKHFDELKNADSTCETIDSVSETIPHPMLGLEITSNGNRPNMDRLEAFDDDDGAPSKTINNLHLTSNETDTCETGDEETPMETAESLPTPNPELGGVNISETQTETVHELHIPDFKDQIVKENRMKKIKIKIGEEVFKLGQLVKDTRKRKKEDKKTKKHYKTKQNSVTTYDGQGEITKSDSSNQVTTSEVNVPSETILSHSPTSPETTNSATSDADIGDVQDIEGVDPDESDESKTKKRKINADEIPETQDTKQKKPKKENAKDSKKAERKREQAKLLREAKRTKQAERRRRERVKERQKELDERYLVRKEEDNEGEEQNIEDTVKDADDPNSSDKAVPHIPVLKRYVLDENATTKEVLIEIDPVLLEKLKPHQVEAVRFMYDCCIESIEELLAGRQGGGCILAHCMGLGKTLSVISFIYTLMSNSELTGMKKCLIVCPLNTVKNWVNEFHKWLFDLRYKVDVYELSNVKESKKRGEALKEWNRKGGVMILGYEMYRNLVQAGRGKVRVQKETYTEILANPGPDLVICDEGHILKNSKSLSYKAMNRIRTKRRVILTGTPLQNNLKEYYHMVNYVKPLLLSTMKNFQQRFIDPITDGQCKDSSPDQIERMKKRVHVLHKILGGCVQRKDYSALTKFLPPKHEYVISVRMGKTQCDLYELYLYLTGVDGVKKIYGRNARLFRDYQSLMKIWTHPWLLLQEVHRKKSKEESKLKVCKQVAKSSEKDQETPQNSPKVENTQENDVGIPITVNQTVPSPNMRSGPDEDRIDTVSLDTLHETEQMDNDLKSEDDGLCERTKLSENTNDVNDSIIVKSPFGSVNDDSGIANDYEEAGWEPKSPDAIDISDDDRSPASPAHSVSPAPVTKAPIQDNDDLTDHLVDYLENLVNDSDRTNMSLSGKMVLLVEILDMCRKCGDKLLVFSQSIPSLNLIEVFLRERSKSANADKVSDTWVRDKDYFRIDGTTSAQKRKDVQKSFNDPKNTRACLFLISTKAGSLGTNLVAANRVIIFDASWNPSHDIQSIFRVYRFGQVKPVYVYRFLAQGTMEEKIYERQVTKLSLSQRVIDEQQIERHFTAADLQALYRFTAERLDDPDREERPLPMLPKDELLASLMTQMKDWIVTFHEHDSLLENMEEEELDEQEKKAAWEEYERKALHIFRPAEPVQELELSNGTNNDTEHDLMELDGIYQPPPETFQEPVESQIQFDDWFNQPENTEFLDTLRDLIEEKCPSILMEDDVIDLVPNTQDYQGDYNTYNQYSTGVLPTTTQNLSYVTSETDNFLESIAGLSPLKDTQTQPMMSSQDIHNNSSINSETVPYGKSNSIVEPIIISHEIHDQVNPDKSGEESSYSENTYNVEQHTSQTVLKETAAEDKVFINNSDSSDLSVYQSSEYQSSEQIVPLNLSKSDIFVPIAADSPLSSEGVPNTPNLSIIDSTRTPTSSKYGSMPSSPETILNRLTSSPSTENTASYKKPKQRMLERMLFDNRIINSSKLFLPETKSIESEPSPIKPTQERPMNLSMRDSPKSFSTKESDKAMDLSVIDIDQPTPKETLNDVNVLSVNTYSSTKSYDAIEPAKVLDLSVIDMDQQNPTGTLDEVDVPAIHTDFGTKSHETTESSKAMEVSNNDTDESNHKEILTQGANMPTTKTDSSTETNTSNDSQDMEGVNADVVRIPDNPKMNNSLLDIDENINNQLPKGIPFTVLDTSKLRQQESSHDFPVKLAEYEDISDNEID